MVLPRLKFLLLGEDLKFVFKQNLPHLEAVQKLLAFLLHLFSCQILIVLNLVQRRIEPFAERGVGLSPVPFSNIDLIAMLWV